MIKVYWKVLLFTLWLLSQVLGALPVLSSIAERESPNLPAWEQSQAENGRVVYDGCSLSCSLYGAEFQPATTQALSDPIGTVPTIPAYDSCPVCAIRTAGAPTVAVVRSIAAKGGETVFTKAGRDAHKLYNSGANYDFKVRLPSGKKPDAVDFVDFDVRIVRELKTNNPRALRRGKRQVEQYRKELEETFGGDWKSVVDTYNR